MHFRQINSFCLPSLLCLCAGVGVIYNYQIQIQMPWHMDAKRSAVDIKFYMDRDPVAGPLVPKCYPAVSSA